MACFDLTPSYGFATAVCEAKRGGRCYVSLATTRLAAPCSAALTVQEREKEKKKERRREKERETEKERARERPVQFEHSKSRWLVPTVSLVWLHASVALVELPRALAAS